MIPNARLERGCTGYKKPEIVIKNFNDISRGIFSDGIKGTKIGIVNPVVLKPGKTAMHDKEIDRKWRCPKSQKIRCCESCIAISIGAGIVE